MLVIAKAIDVIKFNKHIGFQSKKKIASLAKAVKVASQKRYTPPKCMERIIMKKSAGVADVYDIEVPEGHQFIANGLISHNCSPAYGQVMYSFREQLQPLIIIMKEPGVCEFYKIRQWFDRSMWYRLRKVGGLDPVTGEVHRVQLPENRRLIKQYYVKKRYFFHQLQRVQQEEMGGVKAVTGYTSLEERQRRVDLAETQKMEKRIKRQQLMKQMKEQFIIPINDVQGFHPRNVVDTPDADL